jgi:NAD(P)-dependent dehydrogenase (short-subunit alcohol dehydrogenase family)
MGAATKARLEEQGHRVIGVDLHSADAVADLSTRDGRRRMVEEVTELSGGSLDGVIACAGVAYSGASDETAARIAYDSAETAIRVNHFGVVATLEGLRPLLERGTEPRAAAIASTATIRGGPSEVIEACLAGDEDGAVGAIRRYDAATAYGASKRAIARWVRREAPKPEWAGAGIPLNAIGPGRIKTPMSKLVESIPDFDTQFPMPLHGPGQPAHAAALLDWLTSPDNVLVTGQVIFIDGGWDALTRGDDIWA